MNKNFNQNMNQNQNRMGQESDEDRMKRDEERQQKQMEQQEKQMEQQEKWRDEMESKMDAKRFAQMKKQIPRLEKSVARMKKEIARIEKTLKKCNAGLPEELLNARSEADAWLASVKAATDAEGMQDVMEEAQDVMGVMGEWGPKMGELDMLCRELKDAAKTMERVQKKVTTLAKSKNKKDQAIAAELKVLLAELVPLVNEAKETAKTDPEAAFDQIDNEFYDKLREVKHFKGMVGQYNVGRGVDFGAPKEFSEMAPPSRDDVGDIQATKKDSQMSDEQAAVAALFKRA